jgi:hypothetical protein
MGKDYSLYMNKIITVNEVCPACGKNIRFDGGIYYCANGQCLSLTSNDGKATLIAFCEMVENELAKREENTDLTVHI